MADRVSPTRTNLMVFIGLLALTLATTLIARVDLGVWHLPVALAIAAAKTLLIALYFMHLRWSPGLLGLVALGAVLWLAILLGGSMDDYATRIWLLPSGR
jgi:cytochrome c oxidase subunit 4